MNSFATAIISSPLIGLASASNIFEFGLFNELEQTNQEFEPVIDKLSLRGNLVSSDIRQSSLGCVVESTVYDNEYVETVITAPELPFSHDTVQ